MRYGLSRKFWSAEIFGPPGPNIGPGPEKKKESIYCPHSFCHVFIFEMSFDETEESVNLVHEVFQYLKDGKYLGGSIL